MEEEVRTYICHDLRTLLGIWARPNERPAAKIVARPFVPYQAAMRTGCSARRYHWPVMTPKSGRHAASNRPRKKRVVTSPA